MMHLTPADLIVQGVSKTSGLVAAFNRIGIVRSKLVLQILDELEHIFIIWCYLYVGEDPVFPIKYRLHCT